jgi:hypothetical protein
MHPCATVQVMGGGTRAAHSATGPDASPARGRGRASHLACLAGLFLAAHFVLARPATCDGQSLSEYQVKAAYLFNFLKFVEWPDDPVPDAQGKWVIGVVGVSPVVGELTHLVEGKNVLGRDLVVKSFRPTDNLRACNILFISESERKRLPAIFAALRGSSVMTVADMDNFIAAGGMIELDVEDTRVRVTINVNATEHARLKVSSKLLVLARAVSANAKSHE